MLWTNSLTVASGGKSHPLNAPGRRRSPSSRERGKRIPSSTYGHTRNPSLGLSTDAHIAPWQFALKLVLDRQKNPTDTTDMLNLFMDLHKSVPEKFTLRDVIAAAYINV